MKPKFLGFVLSLTVVNGFCGCATRSPRGSIHEVEVLVESEVQQLGHSSSLSPEKGIVHEVFYEGVSDGDYIGAGPKAVADLVVERRCSAQHGIFQGRDKWVEERSLRCSRGYEADLQSAGVGDPLPGPSSPGWY